MTFKEKYDKGEVNLDDIHNYIDDWHNGINEQELHEFLGLGWEDYTNWVKTNKLN